MSTAGADGQWMAWVALPLSWAGVLSGAFAVLAPAIGWAVVLGVPKEDRLVFESLLFAGAVASVAASPLALALGGVGAAFGRAARRGWMPGLAAVALGLLAPITWLVEYAAVMALLLYQFNGSHF